MMNYCFLTVFPSSLHSLTALVRDCLNLPFGTPGRSRKLKPFSYKKEMGVMKGLWYQKDPAGFQLWSLAPKQI